MPTNARLVAEPRQESGKNVTRKMRAAGRVPAVVYGHGETTRMLSVDAHELDLTELLRQWIVLALPMTPTCGPDCPGPQEIDNGDEEAVDNRFAALQQLLDNEDE